MTVKKPRPTRLIVGWRTRAVDGVGALMPAFKAPANYSDPVKIAEYVQNKEAAWHAAAAAAPYLGTFDAVVISDPAHRRLGSWSYKDREPGGKKTPICLAVRGWLLKRYPGAWPDHPPAGHQPLVTFLGFGPRAFLKLLGIECSLPEHAQPLPPVMWYDEVASRGYRDIAEACIPREHAAAVDWRAVFARRRITVPETWAEPGQHPDEDVRLATELATQLGLLGLPEEGDEAAPAPPARAE